MTKQERTARLNDMELTRNYVTKLQHVIRGLGLTAALDALEEKGQTILREATVLDPDHDEIFLIIKHEGMTDVAINLRSFDYGIATQKDRSTYLLPLVGDERNKITRQRVDYVTELLSETLD